MTIEPTSGGVPAVPDSRQYVANELDSYMHAARLLAVSDMIPDAFRGKPANVFWAIRYGKAVGLDEIAIMSEVHVLKGKPTPSAKLVSALVRNAGHNIRTWTEEDDNGVPQRSVTEIRRKDDPEFVFRAVWTMAKARNAELTGNANWKKFPAAMLEARSITEAARKACEEALLGLSYTAEELDPSIVVDEDGKPIGQTRQLRAAPEPQRAVTASEGTPELRPNPPGAPAVVEPAPATTPSKLPTPPVTPDTPNRAEPDEPAERDLPEPQPVDVPEDVPSATPAAEDDGPVFGDGDGVSDEDLAQARGLAGRALTIGDAAKLAAATNWGERQGWLALDVIDVIERPERTALGIRNTKQLPLSKALDAMKAFVEKHGVSVMEYMDNGESAR